MKQQPMTAGELIEFLMQFDQDLPVMFAYNYGDHCQSVVCEPVHEDEAEPTRVKWSDYHRQFKVTAKQEGTLAIVLHSNSVEIPHAEEDTESEPVSQNDVSEPVSQNDVSEPVSQNERIPKLIAGSISKKMSTNEVAHCRKMDMENPMQ